MEDRNIVEINYNDYKEIVSILENRSTRDSFLRVIPPDILKTIDIQEMENESYKPKMTTAEWLLFRLGRKNVLVSEFVQWLEKSKLEKALMVLKKDVPIQIIEQPAPINVYKGTKLSLTCKATSFPRPDYQWLKEGEDGLKELLSEQDEKLIIDCVTEENSGFYCCLVTKTNLDPNSPPISYFYSNPVKVVVLEDSSQNHHIQTHDFDDSDLHFNEESNSESLILYKAKIKCKVHPPYIKVVQGSSIILHCRAEYIDSESKQLTSSELTIQYQWHKNGRPIEGATSANLSLIYLYPDPDTKAKKSEYFCHVFNGFDYEVSNFSVVELENETVDTIHFAPGKYALMFANDTYNNFKHFQPLKTPAKDVADLAKILKEKMNFKVFAYRNLNLTQMKNAFNNFCTKLQTGSYVLLYFAGHGFQYFGQTYLLPVDCGEDYDPKGAITTEYILQCLQMREPALNLLLIDCCRKLPPQFTSKKLYQEAERYKLFQNYELFQAKMEYNTVYGYSTPFLSSAFELKQNSIFAKYLKEYISEEESIIEILSKVQTAFKNDKLVKGIQCPEIRSTLAGNLRLYDEIQRNSAQSDNLRERLVIFPVEPDKFPLFDSKITVNACRYLDFFENDIDISVSMFISKNSPIEILNELEINLISNMPEIQLLPAASVCLKDLDKKVEANNILFKKKAFGIQILQGKTLDCRLKIEFPRLQKCIEAPFKINVKNLTDLKLSVNYLGELAIGKNSP